MTDTPISNWTIERLLSDTKQRANIIEESTITANSDLQRDIFRGHGHVILFHRHHGTPVGHWIAMIQNKDTKQVYYFDPLGDDPYNKNIEKVVLKTYPEFLINDIPYQKQSSNSCGRHVVMVVALNKIGLTPEEIEKFLKDQVKDVDKYVIKNIR